MERHILQSQLEWIEVSSEKVKNIKFVGKLKEIMLTYKETKALSCTEHGKIWMYLYLFLWNWYKKLVYLFSDAFDND